MPDLEEMTPGEVLADASVADFVRSLGLAIAEAQSALDANSVNQIPEFVRPIESLGGRSLLDLGLSPAFYHYQHADLSCSLQLSLKVSTNFNIGLGLNGSYNSRGTTAGSSSQSSSETESGSSSATSERNAQVEITSASSGSLSVGGRSFTLTGADALSRIRGLQQALTADASAGVPRALYAAPTDSFEISTDAPAEKVVTTDRTVTFMRPGWSGGLIRIDEDRDTAYLLDNEDPEVRVTTTAQGSVTAYADHVAAQITARGWNARAGSSTTPLVRVHFRTGRHNIETFTAEGAGRNSDTGNELALLARFSRDRGVRLRVVGHTDAQPYPGGQAASDQANRQLGDRRANEVRDALVAHGASPANVTVTPSTGSADARAAGGAADQVLFRNAEVFFDPGFAAVLVTSRTASQSLRGVSPANLTGALTSGNAWVMMLSPQPLGLTGEAVTIDGSRFGFRGAAAGGHAAGAAESYAANLASDINGDTTVDFVAAADANVVTVYKKNAPFSLTLFTVESRQMTLSGTEGVTVTREFTRTSTSTSTEDATGNTTVAFGASLDVRYGRQYDTTVTGNSSISARLVSIPAPPQFLDVLREFLRPEA
jgi:outer membrane protein OmpA-like peptidoglycan-associated protein